jgi:hypothetical protein
LLAGGRVNWSIQPRRKLNSATSASGEDADSEPSRHDEDDSDSDEHEEQLPLLSVDEVRAEFEAGPNDPPPSFETSNKKIWGERDRTKAFAIIGLQCHGEGKEEPEDFDPDRQSILFDGLPVYVTDDAESVPGSEEDLQLTINSFDFAEQDEDEDESYAMLEGAEERDLATEPLEWDSPKGGEMGDAHDASGSATQTEPEKRTVYPRRRQQTPILHPAAAPAAATGSRLPRQPQAEPVQPAVLNLWAPRQMCHGAGAACSGRCATCQCGFHIHGISFGFLRRRATPSSCTPGWAKGQGAGAEGRETRAGLMPLPFLE